MLELHDRAEGSPSSAIDLIKYSWASNSRSSDGPVGLGCLWLLHAHLAGLASLADRYLCSKQISPQMWSAQEDSFSLSPSVLEVRSNWFSSLQFLKPIRCLEIKKEEVSFLEQTSIMQRSIVEAILFWSESRFWSAESFKIWMLLFDREVCF